MLGSLYAKTGARLAITTRTGGSWAEYALANPMEAMPVPSWLQTKQAAAPFVNPMTVIGFLETAQSAGHKAIVHTAANSALGLMLLRAAPKYDVKIICVVRGDKNAAMLLEWYPQELVVRSDLPSFTQDLKNIVDKTGATVAFDAVGGEMSQLVFDAMPAKSTTYNYGRLSGEPPSPSLVEIGVGADKGFGHFHLALWLDEGGFLRVAKMFYTVVKMLGNELSTNFAHIIPFHAQESLKVINEYYKHQKGGKILLEM